MLSLIRQHPSSFEPSFGFELDRPLCPPQKCSTSRPTWHPAHRFPKPSFIERLPRDVQRLIFSHLDYQSLIFLSMTNRHFHLSVDPQRIATQQDKFEFVMRAANNFKKHWPRENKKDRRLGNSECYWCYRVRAPEHFDVLQAKTAYLDPRGRVILDRDARPGDKPIALRRFCIDCGVKNKLHVPFDCLETKTGQDLWICKCREVWQKPDCLRCPNCLSSCPFTQRRRSG
jgi:hypothetical protein